MSKLDEELTGRFGKAERPLPVDPELFAGLLKKRVRRERMKRASTVGLVLAIGLAGATAYLFAERGTTVRPASTASSSAGATVGASIPGVPFPACHVTNATYFVGSLGHQDGFGAVYLFARGSPSAPCPEVASGNAYFALYRGGVQLKSEPTIFGPIDCTQGCRIFTTPDIDGRVALAVVVDHGIGADSMELYRIHPEADPPFTQMSVVGQGASSPLIFDWGGIGASRAGASCVTVRNPSNGIAHQLDIWHAVLRGGTWHLVERFMTIDGDQVHLDHVARSSAADGFLPDGGGSAFCGSIGSR
jgi:hypothetical protein